MSKKFLALIGLVAIVLAVLSMTVLGQDTSEFEDYLDSSSSPTSLSIYTNSKLCPLSTAEIEVGGDGSIIAQGLEVSAEELAAAEWNADENTLIAESEDGAVSVWRLLDGLMYQVNYVEDGVTYVTIFNWPDFTWVECASFSVED